ncbi:hypothetical protein [Thalassotalea litorea]|uniref:hypothetical protein n=1 Tax=Thalassotalea litorea TaxID=2020715 RepID=UPI003735A07E
MKKIIVLIVMLLIGCQSTQDSYPDFRTPKSEIRDAQSRFRTSDYEILFLLMVDPKGDVVKVRLLGANLKDGQAVQMFKRHMLKAKFKKAKSEDPQFREFILPYGVNTTVTFSG